MHPYVYLLWTSLVPLYRSSSPTSCSLFFLLIRPPPRSTLFPYTTLFRSTHRDLELPDPPDGTQAWTGTGETLTQWTRLNGAWEAIHTGPHYLRIGDDGAPRLWADPELVYDREYAAAPNLHITPFGTIGRSTLPPPVSARGTISIPVSGSAGATATVTFPTGLFSGAPTTFVSRASAGAAKYVAYTVNISASSMTVGVYAGDGTAGSHTAVVSWRAEQ